MRWRAKSEGKLNPPKPSKAPVARADKPTTKRKTATFGAEQGSAKKQKPIVVRGLSGAGAHDGPQTQEDIDRARGARKEREKKKEQKDTPKKIRSINTEVSETSEEEESDDDGSQDETSDEEEDEDEDEEDSQNESSDEE